MPLASKQQNYRIATTAYENGRCLSALIRTTCSFLRNFMYYLLSLQFNIYLKGLLHNTKTTI